VVAARHDLPPSWYAKDDFRDSTAPKIETSAKRVLTVPVTAVHGTTFAGRLAVPDGLEPFRTNISSGPRFVTMTGIRAVGTTRRGLVVAVRAPGSPTTGPVDVTIREASTTVLNAGSAVSAASAIAVLGMLAWPIVRRLRRTPTPTRRTPPS
jgi:hypothetical protein